MNGYNFKRAGPVHLALFRFLAKHCTHTEKVYGLLTPWGIWLDPDEFTAPWLRAHEAAHADQLARDGFIAYWLKTFWYIGKYGYQNSPYEIEARAAQMNANRKGEARLNA